MFQRGRALALQSLFTLARLAAVVACAALVCAASAATIVTYDFGTSGTKTGTIDASVTGSVTASIFDSSDGSTTYVNGNPSSGKALCDDGWKSPGNYWTFTVTPAAGFRLSSTQLVFDDSKIDSSVVSGWDLDYRLGSSGGFTNIASGSAHGSFGTNSVSLSSTSALQGATAALTFEIVGTGGSNNSKRWAIDNVTLTGDTQARASLSTTSATPVAKALVGQTVQYNLTTTNNALAGGTLIAESLNYTLGFSSQTGLSLLTNSASGIARGATATNTIAVNTATSGAKTGSLSVSSTNAWQQSLPTLPTVQVYQAAALTVTGGSSLVVANAAANDGGSAQRAAARLTSLALTSGDPALVLSGLSAGAVITANTSLTGSVNTAGLLNGTYSATYELALEHDDQTILGTSAGDLGVFTRTVTVTVASNNGHQQSALASHRKLKDLSGKSNKSKHTVATFLDGELSNAQIVSMDWREAIPGEGPYGNDLASDVLQLTGTAGTVFVLQMTYEPAAMQPGAQPMLLYNQDGQWVNAVLGNSSGTPIFAGNVAYDPALHFTLGTFGYDSAHNTAWAVIDHNSEFAVPEPASAVLLAFLLFTRRSSRRPGCN